MTLFQLILERPSTGQLKSSHLSSGSSWVLNIWFRFGISYTDYIRTTEKRHAEAVEKVWQRLEVIFFFPINLFLKADISRAEGTFIRQSTVAGIVFRMRLFCLKSRYHFA